MKSTLQKTIIVVFAIAIICAAGCQESQTPSQKQSRVIAARNMELEKQVAERDKQIGDLKAQYTVRVGLEQKKLAACQKQIADCKGQLGKAMDEKVNEVLISSIEEGAKIHAENVKLKAEIAELKAKLNPLKEPEAKEVQETTEAVEEPKKEE